MSPTVPTYGGRKVGTAPLSLPQVSANTPAGAFGVATPSPIGGALEIAQQIVERERSFIDKVAATEAANERDARDLAIEREAREKFKGKDALAAATWAAEERKRYVEPIAKRLNNRVKPFFKGQDEAARIRLEARLNAYADREVEQYAANEISAAAKLSTERAAQEPQTSAAELNRSTAMLRWYANERGLGPERTAEILAAHASAHHSAVFESLVGQGRDVAAEAYAKAHLNEFAGEARSRVEKSLEVLTTDRAAQGAVDAVWSELGPSRETDPVRLADMEAKLRERFGEQPSVLRAARQELRTRVDAFNAQATQVTAANKAAVLGAFNEGASLAQVRRMPAYRALDGADQNQVSSYIVDRGHALSERARAQRERRQGEVAWRIAQSPASVAAMSEAEIRAREPDIGPSGVEFLLKQKQGLTSPAKVYESQLDVRSFETFLDGAEITDPGDRGKLWLAFNREIEATAAARQHQLNHTERQEVMQAVIDRRVLVDRFGWGTGKREEILALVDQEPVESTSIPLEKLPPDGVMRSLNWMRSSGIIAPGLSDREAKERYRSQLERAAAAERRGLGWPAVEAILRERVR